MHSAVGANARVLQVLYSFRVGGSEMFGLELARQLVEHGVQVQCGALDGLRGPLWERCARYGIEPVDLGVPTQNFFARNGVSPALVRRLRALRPHAVHLQHFLGLNKLGIPARLAGIPRVVVTEHTVFDVAQSLAGRMRARLTWRLADAITVIHPSIRDYLCDHVGIPRERIRVIPIGVDTDRYTSRDRATCRARLGLGDDVTFVFVGRIAPVKDVPGLITAFLSVMARRGGGARLLVVGDGAEKARCEQLVAGHAQGTRVSLVGEQSDTRPYLSAADAFVMNPRSEGTPRALLEAMSTGLTAICPAIGGIPDMLAGRGWLTTPGDRASLETALEKVLTDTSAIAPLGALCREYVKSHNDAGKVFEQYRHLLLDQSEPHQA
jgi:glycosyltransferase involved in cell wall biosynthesis